MASQNLDTASLAKILDITPRQILNLTADGVLSRARDEHGEELRGRYNLFAVRDYCRYLRSLSRLDDSSESLKTALTNRRLAADAEMSELKLMQYKGLLHHAADVEFCMTNMLTFFKQRVLAVPSRIARQLVGKKKFSEIYDIIMTEIVLCLRELSGYDPQMFAQQNAARLAEQGMDASTLNGKDNTAPEAPSAANWRAARPE